MVAVTLSYARGVALLGCYTDHHLLRSLQLLETCVKNCHAEFHVFLAGSELWQDMLKLCADVSITRIDVEVRDKILSLVEDFARALQPLAFTEAYQDLLVSPPLIKARIVSVWLWPCACVKAACINMMARLRAIWTAGFSQEVRVAPSIDLPLHAFICPHPAAHTAAWRCREPLVVLHLLQERGMQFPLRDVDDSVPFLTPPAAIAPTISPLQSPASAAQNTGAGPQTAAAAAQQAESDAGAGAGNAVAVADALAGMSDEDRAAVQAAMAEMDADDYEAAEAGE